METETTPVSQPLAETTPRAPAASAPHEQGPLVDAQIEPKPLIEKPCFYCSTSCVGHARVKDRSGQYAHKACRNALEHPRKSKRPRGRKPMARPDFLEGFPDLTPAIYFTVPPCPGCQRPVHPRAVLCTHCGTDLLANTPAAQPAPSSTHPHTGTWTLGLVVGAAIGAVLWTTFAQSIGRESYYTASLIAAAMGATLIFLGHAARLVQPK